MKINVRVEADKAVFVLGGRLVRGEHLRLLREKVDTLLREGCREFVVDLKSVSYVDSASLGELVAIHARVQQQGRLLRVTGLTKRITDLTVVSGLRDIFEVEPGQLADPLDPQLRDLGWEFRLGVALAILVIIGAMIIVLR